MQSIDGDCCSTMVILIFLDLWTLKEEDDPANVTLRLATKCCALISYRMGVIMKNCI